MLTRIGAYYAYRMPQLFDRLCEAIVLLAAMFTVAMMLITVWQQRRAEKLAATRPDDSEPLVADRAFA